MHVNSVAKQFAAHSQVDLVACAAEYIHHLESGDPVHPTLSMANNLEYMAILDAGLRSARSGKLEAVENAALQIG
jgi:hypothetical protein